jgi:hypothetical protein
MYIYCLYGCILKQCLNVLHSKAQQWLIPAEQETLVNQIRLQVFQATLGFTSLWVLRVRAPQDM